MWEDSGNVIRPISATKPLPVDLGSNNDVSVSSSALPSGAATSANQLADGHNVTVDNSGGLEVVQDTPADLTATVTQASSERTITGTVAVGQNIASNLKAIVTQQSASRTISSSVLPTGASTSTLQGTTNTKLDTLEATLSSIETDQAAIEVLLTAGNVLHTANESLLTTIDADTGAIKTAIEILDNAISGSQMQVDIVEIAAGTNRIGMVALKANEAADGSGTERHLLCDAQGHLQVDVLSGGGGGGAGTEYTEGDTDATITGTAILWEDTLETLRSVSAAKPLPIGNLGLTELAAAINSSKMDVNIVSGGFGGAVTGTFWQATQPVSGTFWQATQPVSGTVTANLPEWGVASDAALFNGTIHQKLRYLTEATLVANTPINPFGSAPPLQGMTMGGENPSGVLSTILTDANGKLDIVGTLTVNTVTEYTEGDVDGTITGPAIMWEDTGNTLRAVSASKPLPVDGSGVTQPVSGTVTANLSATDNAVLDTINTANVGSLSKLGEIQVHLDAIETDIAANEVLLGSGNALTGITNSGLATQLSVLNDIEATLTNVETDQAAIEALITTANIVHGDSNSKLATIDADTDAIKTAIEGTLAVNVADVTGLATHAKQDTIIGHVDGLEGILTVVAGHLLTIDADTNDMKIDLAASEILQTSTNTKLDTLENTLTAIDSDTGDISDNTLSIDGNTDTTATQVTSMNSKITACNTGAIAGTVAVTHAALTELGTAISGGVMSQTHLRHSNAVSGKVSVLNTSTEIVSITVSRASLYIVNDSDAVIYLGIDEAAVMNEGVRLNAYGGSFTDESYNGVVNGITAVTGKNVTVCEVVV